MPPKPNAATTANRGPLYVIGGILLVVVLVGYWFSDDLATLFEATPDASSIEGSWVFDSARAKELLVQSYGSDQQLPSMEKGYGKAVFTFAPGTITMDNGSGKAAAIACKVQGYPPNAYLVTIGEGKTQREFVFQLDTSKDVKQLYLSTEGNMVPFKPKN